MIGAVLITVSTSRAGGDKPDQSGDRLVELATAAGAGILAREVIPDDVVLITERLTHWAEEGGADLILTSGGTGFSPSDHTPEATSAVIERPAPGIAEAIRQEAARHTRHWVLSRAVAGIRGSCLIVNLPGSPAGVEEAGPVLLPILPHALELIADRPPHHQARTR